MRLKLPLIHLIHLKPPWLQLTPKRKNNPSKATHHLEQHCNTNIKATNKWTAERDIGKHSDGPTVMSAMLQKPMWKRAQVVIG